MRYMDGVKERGEEIQKEDEMKAGEKERWKKRTSARKKSIH